MKRTQSKAVKPRKGAVKCQFLGCEAPATIRIPRANQVQCLYHYTWNCFNFMTDLQGEVISTNAETPPTLKRNPRAARATTKGAE